MAVTDTNDEGRKCDTCINKQCMAKHYFAKCGETPCSNSRDCAGAEAGCEYCVKNVCSKRPVCGETIVILIRIAKAVVMKMVIVIAV